jgi:hypothetical protein
MNSKIAGAQGQGGQNYMSSMKKLNVNDFDKEEVTNIDKNLTQADSLFYHCNKILKYEDDDYD